MLPLPLSLNWFPRMGGAEPIVECQMDSDTGMEVSGAEGREDIALGNWISIQVSALSGVLSKSVNLIASHSVFGLGEAACCRGREAKCGVKRPWSQLSHLPFK